MIIDSVVGDRSYSAFCSQYSRKEETMTFQIELDESDDIDGMQVQFGADAFTSATFLIEADEEEQKRYEDEFYEVL